MAETWNLISDQETEMAYRKKKKLNKNVHERQSEMVVKSGLYLL